MMIYSLKIIYENPDNLVIFYHKICRSLMKRFFGNSLPWFNKFNVTKKILTNSRHLGKYYRYDFSVKRVESYGNSKLNVILSL